MREGREEMRIGRWIGMPLEMNDKNGKGGGAEQQES